MNLDFFKIWSTGDHYHTIHQYLAVPSTRHACTINSHHQAYLGTIQQNCLGYYSRRLYFSDHETPQFTAGFVLLTNSIIDQWGRHPSQSLFCQLLLIHNYKPICFQCTLSLPQGFSDVFRGWGKDVSGTYCIYGVMGYIFRIHISDFMVEFFCKNI